MGYNSLGFTRKISITVRKTSVSCCNCTALTTSLFTPHIRSAVDGEMSRQFYDNSFIDGTLECSTRLLPADLSPNHLTNFSSGRKFSEIILSALVLPSLKFVTILVRRQKLPCL
ncbi:hypothetical protein PoB_004623100 [Plakobranchus ocellatus]|uniref:Uncharacterized protein n=1 Tax=Plakobranchus ocellatus TaxID=259542 RepID=A0AAV4BL60_9GAST|nr:hypothetical protein PoB_004623100 [Plakobranchus ocellatus]